MQENQLDLVRTFNKYITFTYPALGIVNKKRKIRLTGTWFVVLTLCSLLWSNTPTG
jgi:hypothetical protein